MQIKRRVWIPALSVAVLLVSKHFLLDTAAEAKGDYVIDVEALHRAAIAGGALLPQAACAPAPPGPILPRLATAMATACLLRVGSFVTIGRDAGQTGIVGKEVPGR